MKFKENEKVEVDQQKIASENKVELDISRRECTLSETMQKMMLRQLIYEMKNHNLYRTFANFYGVRGLTLLEEYYNRRAEEEMVHHSWVLGYLSETDTEFVYPTIPPIIEKWNTLEKPFDITVDAEIETTQMIQEMLDQSLEEGDYFTYDFLMGRDPNAGQLLHEQREEENTSRTVRDIIYTEGSWLRKEKSVLEFYNRATGVSSFPSSDD